MIEQTYTNVYNCMQEVMVMEKEQNIHLHEGHRSNRRKMSDRRENGRNSAKTFRRGRALAFYEKLMVKRDTLKKQLASPEYQSIQTVIAGELKATESIMDDFKAAFELDELSLEMHEE